MAAGAVGNVHGPTCKVGRLRSMVAQHAGAGQPGKTYHKCELALPCSSGPSPDTARAVACSSALSCRLWNMSA